MSSQPDELRDLLARPPTPLAQQRALELLRARVEPVRLSHRLADYQVQPGLRLRRLWGRCEIRDGQLVPRVLVRCTRMDAPGEWRTLGSLTATLLHEVAHLKHRGHSAPFWAFYRRLLADAAILGALDVQDVDLAERSRGDEKLADSVLHVVAKQAQVHRRQRAAANRDAARGWQAGSRALALVRRRPLAGAEVEVVAVARSWVTVRAPGGALYRVAASALRPVER